MNRYEIKGQWYTVKELSEMSGLLQHTIRDRIRRGYSVEQAISTIPTNDTVKEFCDASHWKDWVGMSISELYEIYWKWCVSGNGYTPISKQGFSRHLMQMYPIKTVPTKSGETYSRIIRVR